MISFSFSAEIPDSMRASRIVPSHADRRTPLARLWPLAARTNHRDSDTGPEKLSGPGTDDLVRARRGIRGVGAESYWKLISSRTVGKPSARSWGQTHVVVRKSSAR